MTIIDHNKKYIIMSNMKCGLTSINNFFSNFNPDIISNKSIYEKPIGKHATYNMIKYYLLSINKNIDDYNIFIFIREPVDRLISCFNYETIKRKKDIKTWYDYNYSNTQEDFERYINYKSVHFHQLDEMIYNDDNEIPNNITILKYENFEDNVKLILDRLNLKTDKKLKNLNNTKKHNIIKINDEIKNKIYKMYPIDTSYYTNLFNS